MKRDFLVQNKKLYGKKVVPFEMPDERSIDINSFYDIKIAECLLRQMQKNHR
jgi:CMP-N-acetylneuraminic acid synthetase